MLQLQPSIMVISKTGVKKGRRIAAGFYTHGGFKRVKKWSWMCRGCGREYQTRNSAERCNHTDNGQAHNLIGMEGEPLSDGYSIDFWLAKDEEFSEA